MSDLCRTRETNLHIHDQLSKTFLYFLLNVSDVRFLSFSPSLSQSELLDHRPKITAALSEAPNVEKEPFSSKDYFNFLWTFFE